jgi:hypothetical protein
MSTRHFLLVIGARLLPLKVAVVAEFAAQCAEPATATNPARRMRAPLALLSLMEQVAIAGLLVPATSNGRASSS